MAVKRVIVSNKFHQPVSHFDDVGQHGIEEGFLRKMISYYYFEKKYLTSSNQKQIPKVKFHHKNNSCSNSIPLKTTLFIQYENLTQWFKKGKKLQ